MTTIALNFKGMQTDRNGGTYMTFIPNKDLTPITIDKDKLITVKWLPPSDNEKAPKFAMDMFVPIKQEDKKE